MSIFGIGIEVFVINILIAIPVFFFFRWLLKKTKFSIKSRQLLSSIGTVIITPLIYVGLVLSFIFLISYYPSKEFDQQEWMDEPSERYEMSEDIIESELLIGKTKKEVEKMLGPSNDMEKDNWAYMLGFVPGIANIDPSVLLIFFENGKVVKVSQHKT
ncbi:hypothetical protein [Gracilimonas tropica]|uniref:hypothetical protein n=1 Tax=Gracilimonas tropica TaxID=454600 RepID=UPI00036BA066|nr:hypothetical protein [Gracilimonas tropica]